MTLGKKYARTDEIGVPFGITVDKQTLSDQTVTLREIETVKQVRIPIKEAYRVVSDLSASMTTWSEVLQRYPLFEHKEEDEEESKQQE